MRERSDQARAILESPVFAEACAALEERYRAALWATQPEDHEGRERLYRQDRARAEFIADLRGLVSRSDYLDHKRATEERERSAWEAIKEKVRRR